MIPCWIERQKSLFWFRVNFLFQFLYCSLYFCFALFLAIVPMTFCIPTPWIRYSWSTSSHFCHWQILFSLFVSVHACEINKGGCSHICKKAGDKVSCACPVSVTIPFWLKDPIPGMVTVHWQKFRWELNLSNHSYG